MQTLNFKLRWLGFLSYFAILFALPFGFLASEIGTIMGLTLYIVVLFYIRSTGESRLIKRLKLKKVYLTQQMPLSTVLSEQARRLSLPVPDTYLLPSNGLNLGAFSLSKKDNLLFFTTGLIETLPRAELEALCARQLLELQTPDLRNRSWLSLFLILLELPATSEFKRNYASVKRFYPVGIFLRQLILYPLCWAPIHIVGIRQNTAKLDEVSLSLTGNRRALSEAYRTLEAYRERNPVYVPFAFHSLFLASPASLDPIAQVFVYSYSLNQRIYQLEGRT